MKKKYQSDPYMNFISHPEISFWVPILTSVVTITLSYGTLMTRVSVLENKMDTMIAGQSIILEKYTSVESRYGQLSNKITRLETLLGQ